MSKEREILNEFLARKNLRHSAQRERVLEEFLAVERHMTAEELYDILKRKNPEIGCATVYRSMKIFSQCGLAREVKLGNRKSSYEHVYHHKHHDHLICLKCGKMVEFSEPTIEKFQQRVAGKYGFEIEDHSLAIYGVCRDCK